MIRPGDRVADVASGPMLREAAVSGSTVGAQGLWMGFVRLEPGLMSSVHHHADAESGIYLISGRARFYGGEGLRDVLNAEAGDFIWVPPHAVHAEQNPFDQPAIAVVARSTQEGPVVDVEPPEGWSPPT